MLLHKRRTSYGPIHVCLSVCVCVCVCVCVTFSYRVGNLHDLSNFCATMGRGESVVAHYCTMALDQIGGITT
jgi:hypothetical protein